MAHTNIITLKTQLHAVNARWKRMSQRSLMRFQIQISFIFHFLLERSMETPKLKQLGKSRRNTMSLSIFEILSWGSLSHRYLWKPVYSIKKEWKTPEANYFHCLEGGGISNSIESKSEFVQKLSTLKFEFNQSWQSNLIKFGRIRSNLANLINFASIQSNFV